MVAVPVGGYVVVKVGGMALERAAFMLRRLRSVDDVVDRAKALGLRPRYAASETELRAVAGDAASYRRSSCLAPSKGHGIVNILSIQHKRCAEFGLCPRDVSRCGGKQRLVPPKSQETYRKGTRETSHASSTLSRPTRCGPSQRIGSDPLQG